MAAGADGTWPATWLTVPCQFCNSSPRHADVGGRRLRHHLATSRSCGRGRAMAHGCERKWQARPSASSETFSCSSEAAWTLQRRLQRTRMALVATHGSRYRYDRLTEKSARAIIAIFFFLFGKQRQKILSPVDSICDSVHRSLASYYSFSYSTRTFRGTGCWIT